MEVDNFYIIVEYDKEEKMIYIGLENGALAKYHCKDIEEIKNSISFYIQNYLTISKEDIEPELDK